MKIIFLLLSLFLLSGCTVHQYVIEHEPRHLRQHLWADSDKHRWYYKEATTPHIHGNHCNWECEHKPRQARKVYYYDY